MEEKKYTTAKTERRAAEMKRALRSVRNRNTALMRDAQFRIFMDLLADGCGFLQPAREDLSEYQRGRADAIRDIVSNMVLMSDGGPEWLAGYAKSRERKVESDGQ